MSTYSHADLDQKVFLLDDVLFHCLSYLGIVKEKLDWACAFENDRVFADYRCQEEGVRLLRLGSPFNSVERSSFEEFRMITSP